MNFPVFSIRSILSIIIGMIGLLALALALLSGSIHKNLVLDNQQTMMRGMIGIAVNERLKDLADISQELGLSLQSTPAFQKALYSNDSTTLLQLLNNQFHQYFVTGDVIKLEQLILFDKNFSRLTESKESSSLIKSQQTVCPQLLDRARLRIGSERMTIMHDLCLHEGNPIHATIVPVGGLRLKGYIMIVTDPSHNLTVLESNLGMPLCLRLNNKKSIFESDKWPKTKKDSLISGYELKTSSGIPVLTILIAQNINALSQKLQQARVDVLLISGAGTLFIVLLSILIMRRTMLNPLSRLAYKLHSLHIDKSRIGEQLEVTGTKEIHEIIEGFNDMSLKLSKLYQSLKNMAYTDSLTELPNRHLFQETLKNTIQLHQQINKPFTLLLIDLNRFKGVNDTLGHHIGDELLKAVSLRLQDTLRNNDIFSRLDQESIAQFNNDIIARLGGDEFSAILTGLETTQDSVVVARKLISAMEQPFKVNEHQLTIGLSIGIATYPEHGNDIHTLVRHADIAMYDAKNRNCGFSTYNHAQKKHSLHNLKLEQALFESIKKNELVLHYQPKISVATGKVIGAEALIRWQHPEHGLISPDNFIPLAEQSGFIQPLTEWVLNKAMENCCNNIHADRHLNISVNLSALNLRDEKISSTLTDTVKKWSIAPENFTLELTENAIMSDPEFAIKILKKLKAMGVSLSIDDFGTGYSSLTYVKELPVDELKIDKSFIKNLSHDSNNQAIVRAVLVLAHRMNLLVVAEGVEDVETLDMLRELGCNIAQGYYFAKPMPFEEYLTWLEKN